MTTSSDDSQMSEAAEADITQDNERIPAIIKFAFTDFARDEAKNKHSGRCSVCKGTIVDKIGVTSAFTK